MRPTNLTGRGSFALILLTMLFLFTSVAAIAQEFAKGVVTNAAGKPLEGVTILLKQKNASTTTAADGTFSIAAPKGAILMVSYVGFEAQEYKLSNLTDVKIVLQEKTNTMDNVIVIGYGTVQKKDLTGAVGSINEKDLEKASINTPDKALQGKLSGVQVHTNSHAPGGGISVSIRGTASLSAGGSPLYVIDGVPIVNDFVTGRSTDIGSFGPPPNPLNSIDPSEIASIQVLKDASATAIYGSRAANGVVLITTKRGKSGQQNIDVEYSYGLQQVRKKLKFLDATQWATQANEMSALRGQPKIYTDEQIAGFGKGTDWQDEVFRKAPDKGYKLSFSGGTSAVRYLVAGNVTDQDGIITGSNFKRYGTTLNIDADVNKRLKIGESLLFSYTANKVIPTDTKGYEGISNIIDAIYEAPPTIAPRDSLGQPNNLANFPLGAGKENPLTMTEKYKQQSNTARLLANVFANYNLAKGLDLNIRFGIDLNDWRWGEYYPIGSEAAAGTNGKARQVSMRNLNYTSSNTLSYQTTVGKIHSIKALAGYTYQTNKAEVLDASSFGFPSDVFQDYNLGLGSSPQTPGSNASKWTLISYLGRINYSLLDKYLVTASIRADGDSKFGKNNKYGLFPSAAFAWQAGSEEFIQNLNVFSQLKVRASYGKTGNESIGVYRSLSLLATAFGSRSSYIFNGTKVPIAYPQNLANSDLSWEKTSEYNMGLDMGFFKNRLNLSVDYYYKKTTDLLLDVPVPSQSGYGSVLQNTGAMLNKGFEFMLNTINFEGRFGWTTNFNISFNKNAILSLGGAPYQYTGWVGGANVTPHDKNTARLQPGHSVGEFYGSIYEGVWQSQEEINKAGTQLSAKPGDIRYKDVNGDGKYDTEKDDVFLGNPNPDFSYGLTNDFTFGQFNMHVFLYGEYGNDVLNLAAQQLKLDGIGPSIARLDRWSPTNTSGYYPSAGAANPQRVSSILIEGGSFMRIQNISLGYNLPVKNIGALSKWVRSTRLSVGVDNLAIITGYSGYDPEVNSYGTSNTAKGMDRFGYPPARTFRLNLQFGF